MKASDKKSPDKRVGDEHESEEESFLWPWSVSLELINYLILIMNQFKFFLMTKNNFFKVILF